MRSRLAIDPKALRGTAGVIGRFSTRELTDETLIYIKLIMLIK